VAVFTFADLATIGGRARGAYDLYAWPWYFSQTVSQISPHLSVVGKTKVTEAKAAIIMQSHICSIIRGGGWKPKWRKSTLFLLEYLSGTAGLDSFHSTCLRLVACGGESFDEGFCCSWVLLFRNCHCFTAVLETSSSTTTSQFLAKDSFIFRLCHHNCWIINWLQRILWECI
jgi:hypothetical protein